MSDEAPKSAYDAAIARLQQKEAATPKPPEYTVIASDGKEFGPCPLPTLLQWIHQGRVAPATSVRRNGEAPVAASTLPETAAAFGPGRAALPPRPARPPAFGGSSADTSTARSFVVLGVAALLGAGAFLALRDRPARNAPAPVVADSSSDARPSDARPSAASAPATLSQPKPTPQGSMFVQSAPSGARVFVNGRQEGITPVVLSGVPTGKHEVRFELPGYAPESSTAVVRGDGRTSLNVTLQRMPASSAATPPLLPAAALASQRAANEARQWIDRDAPRSREQPSEAAAERQAAATPSTTDNSAGMPVESGAPQTDPQVDPASLTQRTLFGRVVCAAGTQRCTVGASGAWFTSTSSAGRRILLICSPGSPCRVDARLSPAQQIILVEGVTPL